MLQHPPLGRERGAVDEVGRRVAVLLPELQQRLALQPIARGVEEEGIRSWARCWSTINSPVAVSASPTKRTGPGRSGSIRAANRACAQRIRWGRTGTCRPSTRETNRKPRRGFRRAANPQSRSSGAAASSTRTTSPPVGSATRRVSPATASSLILITGPVTGAAR